MKTLLAVALATASAHAGQVCHTQSHASAPPTWTQGFQLPKHAPELGALQSVTVSIHGFVSGSVSAENPSSSPAEFAIRLAFRGSVQRPDGSEIGSLEPGYELQIPFAAFDGQVDFAGGSGIVRGSLAADVDHYVSLTSPADLALFTAASAGELITLGVSALDTTTAQGPGPLVTQLVTNAAMDVRVCYGFRESTQSASVPMQSTNWQQPLLFAKHDPAVGPLRAVRLRARTTLMGMARHESLDSSPSDHWIQFSTNTKVLRPDSSIALAFTTYQLFLDPCTPFDGVLDFGGTSGGTHAGIVVTSATEVTLTSAADLTSFTASTPGEQITLHATGEGSSIATGLGGVVIQFFTAAATEIELCYDYSAPITPFCFGDGSGTVCPCGNASTPGAQQGCRNSYGLGGELRGAGFAEIGADTLVLTASNLPANTSVLFFQGTSAISVTFGDGLRCAGGSIRRLGVRAALAGSATFPPAGTTVSQAGMAATGSTLRYQAWYRNSAAFCTASTFNLTNGLAIAW